MTAFDDTAQMEATAEQLDALRELGVAEEQIRGMNFADAEELIAELEAERDREHQS
jgi:hypothetical protein